MIFNHIGKLKIHLETESGTAIPQVSFVDSHNDLTVEVWELFRAIIACGTPPIDFLPRTTYSRISEIGFKRAIMDFALSVDCNNHDYVVWDNERLDRLDSSERGVIRFYVGMWMAWIVANKLYGMDFLCHYKRFIEETGCRFERNGRNIKIGNLSEPDFIGMKYDSTTPVNVRYSVFEAKGGKSRRQDTVDKAINRQLPVIREMDGRSPNEYVLAYSVCNPIFQTPNGTDIDNVLNVIIGESKSNQIRPDAYDIVIDKNSSQPAYIFEKYIIDLFEEVGMIEKNGVVYSFANFDIKGSADGDKITLEIMYDAMRSVVVDLDRSSGVVSIQEKRNVRDAAVVTETAHIVDGDGRIVY